MQFQYLILLSFLIYPLSVKAIKIPHELLIEQSIYDGSENSRGLEKWVKNFQKTTKRIWKPDFKNADSNSLEKSDQKIKDLMFMFYIGPEGITDITKFYSDFNEKNEQIAITTLHQAFQEIKGKMTFEGKYPVEYTFNYKNGFKQNNEAYNHYGSRPLNFMIL